LGGGGGHEVGIQSFGSDEVKVVGVDTRKGENFEEAGGQMAGVRGDSLHMRTLAEDRQVVMQLEANPVGQVSCRPAASH
jgi:hypothetical protein